MAERMRADARRNLEQLLVAARDVILQRGPDVPLEEIARAAGVGIATLYRRFPDRQALLSAVVSDALEKTAAAAERAELEEDDALEALARYLREALELRVSALIPMLLDVVDLEELRDVRGDSANAVERLIDRAHEEKALPADVTFSDIAMMLVRIARPLPGPMPDEMKHDLAKRHLELFIRGLGITAHDSDLAGPGLSLQDLQKLTSGTGHRD